MFWIVLWAAFLSLTHSWKLGPVSFSVCISFPSDCNAICVLWAQGWSWTVVCHDFFGYVFFSFCGGIAWRTAVSSYVLFNCVFPVKTWIAIWLLTCSGFVPGLFGVGEWVPEVLDKPGGSRTTWTDPLSWVSSPQPWRALEGRSGSKGLRCREGTDFLVLGVCGCSRIQACSGVGVCISSVSSPA